MNFRQNCQFTNYLKPHGISLKDEHYRLIELCKNISFHFLNYYFYSLLLWREKPQHFSIIYQKRVFHHILSYLLLKLIFSLG